jgi:hypothetical protein
MPDETPDWVNDTPDECCYDLTMFDSGGGSIEESHIDRAEYLALKAKLAEMRGYSPHQEPKP